MYKTLVLNKDFIPISIFPLHYISAKNAIIRVFNETCTVVIEYDEYIKTPNIKIKWPAVVARTEYLSREKLAVLNRRSLWYRDRMMCAYCRKIVPYQEATFDHVIPRYRGGRHVWENVVLSCAKCNHTKSDSLPVKQWKPFKKPYKPTYGQLLKLRKQYPITVYHSSWKDFIGSWDAEVYIV